MAREYLLSRGDAVLLFKVDDPIVVILFEKLSGALFFGEKSNDSRRSSSGSIDMSGYH